MQLLPKPTIEDWKSDKYKQLALNANKYLDIALEEGLLDSQEILKRGIISDGDSSIVFYLETKYQKYIVKFSPSPKELVVHKLFFEEWAKQGVLTPKIFKIRTADEQIPYDLALMEFIEAETLSQRFSKKELFQEGYYEILGTTLARMHKVKGKGFRELKDVTRLEGQYSSLKEELDYDIKGKRLDFLIENEVLNAGIEEKYFKARDILSDDLGSDMPSLCHNDFLPYNIFATDPITVFDPSPSISSPIKDLGGSISKILMKDNPYSKDAAKQMVDGYEKEWGSINKEALDAAVFLINIRKLARAFRSGDKDRVEKLVDFVENKNF